MGYIEEPKNMDLVIAGGKLTPEDRKLIRAMIARQKSARKSKAVRVRDTAPTRTKKARKTTRARVKA